VLVLVGTDTRRYATAYARHVVDYVPNAQMRKIHGAGHAAPLTRPEALADALTEFLTPAERPADAGQAAPPQMTNSGRSHGRPGSRSPTGGRRAGSVHPLPR
jgi:hypothetical protein